MKAVLNRGRHPTFIGRTTVTHRAVNGGVFFFVVGGEDAAVAIVNPRASVLQVLCVAPEWRGQGLGAELVRFLKPNWVRAVESAVPWFEKLGYEAVGDWKQGRVFRTRVMVRASLRRLAGRLRDRLAQGT